MKKYDSSLNSNIRGRLLGIRPTETWMVAIELDRQDFLPASGFSSVPEGQGYVLRRSALEACIRRISCTNIGFLNVDNLAYWCKECVAISHDAVFEDYERIYSDPRENIPPNDEDARWVEIFRYGVFFSLLDSNVEMRESSEIG